MDTTDAGQEPETVTRAYPYALDVTPVQDRLLRSYCGAARFAYNRALTRVEDNLTARATELAEDVPEDERRPAVSWSYYAMSTRFNAVKDGTAPWWREVSNHAFKTGLRQCAEALDNFRSSSNGTRKGRRIGFPTFKSRMAKKSGRRRLGRALSDVALGKLEQLIDYKTTEYGHRLVEANRWFPSSKRCSSCGAVRAKLPLNVRRFDCESCGLKIGRDVKAAPRNLAWWGRQMSAGRDVNELLAGLRPESRKDDPRPCKTKDAPAVSGQGSLEDTTAHRPATAVSDGDGTLVTASGRQ